MKHLIFILTAFSCGVVFGQQKDTTQISLQISEPNPKIIPYAELLPEDREETKQCFVYITEKQKDSLVYVTENLLEYGWNGSNARIVITTYNYEVSKKKKINNIVTKKQLQFIDGEYKIDNGKLTFTPNKDEKFEQKTFNLIYNKMKIDYLEDENGNKYTSGGCSQPIMSL